VVEKFESLKKGKNYFYFKLSDSVFNKFNSAHLLSGASIVVLKNHFVNGFLGPRCTLGPINHQGHQIITPACERWSTSLY